MCGPTPRRSTRVGRSCGHQLTPWAPGRFRRGDAFRSLERLFAGACQGVEAAAGTVLARDDMRILPAALEQAHALEARQRAVERAVRREQFRVGGFADAFGDFVAVEFVHAAAAQCCGRVADREFQRHELTWFPSHGERISRYMRISQDRSLTAEER